MLPCTFVSDQEDALPRALAKVSSFRNLISTPNVSSRVEVDIAFPGQWGAFMQATGVSEKKKGK